MEDSTFDLITALCSELVEDALCYHPTNKKSIIKSLRSKAYGIVLNNKNVHTEDESERSPTLLLADILGHVYGKAKTKGQWTKDLLEDVGHVIYRAEQLAECNPSFTSVLRFLIHLADCVPASGTGPYQQGSCRADMKISISDQSFKHEPLFNPHSTFNPAIFEVCPEVSSDNVQGLQSFCELPGTGLKHQQFFFSSTIPSTCTESRIYEDVNNGNWVHSKLNNLNIRVNNPVADLKFSMHQDEGYVTPDQDLVENQDPGYIPWEDMVEDFNLVYSWNNFGSAMMAKEPQFIFERRDSINSIGRVIHASDVISSKTTRSDLTTLKTVSLQELEVAFKNLLVGVESSIFHYDQGRRSFVLKKGLCLKGSTASTLEEYCEDFIECGNHFRQLSKVTELSGSLGLVFQALCNNIRQYLQCYRGVVLEMSVSNSLLESRDWLHKLSTQTQFLISLCPLKAEKKTKDLLIYLCDKMPVLYRHDLSYVYYYILQSCFTVYFMFLSKWIFEGVSNRTWEEEFFIRCNPMTEEMCNRKFWSEGFVLDYELVPNCLKGLESKLLLCGKSMALLKLCASEDPICKEVKKHCPEIVCCFNRVDLANVEKKFESYKESCKAHCQHLYGNTKPEPHDEEHYADLMAKTLDQIKGRQEEERRLKAEKKHIQFNVLKKEMEDAQERKIQEKIITMETEKKLIEEAKKLDEINDLRRQEEREKIMQYYSSLSDAADRRRDRAEWKMKRAELHDKRCEFWKKETEWLEENKKFETQNVKCTNESELLSSDKSLEKYLKTYEPIQASGDYIDKVEPSFQEARNKSVDQNEEQQVIQDGGGEHHSLKTDELRHCIEDGNQLSDDKKDWLIALDVAEQARQSALKFKQRNMHNDYNIITGKESTFESRFHSKAVIEHKEDTVSLDTIISNEDSGDLSQAGVSITASGNDINEGSENIEVVETSTSLNQTSHSKLEDGSFSEPSSHTTSATSHSDCEGHIQEIDMTSLYQYVQRSVIIPLTAQLELTSDAIVRLYSKHNLLQHIECIWKYFFLLEGEFARNLTTNIFKETQKAQHPSYLLNVMKLNSLLRCAVGTNTDEEYTERLSFYVKEIPLVFRTIDPEMLNCLSLRYKTYWPINIIITDEIIAKQDLIFKHLLKLHRSSWALEEVIYLLKDKKLFSSEEYRKVQLYRHVMSHFIASVKQYLTAVVIEKTWYEFKKKFQAATTVDTMYEVYRCYVRNVNSKCLLGKARVHTEQLFNNLFKEVLIFYEALRSGEWIQETAKANENFRHSNFSRLNHAFENFKKLADHLVYLFKKMSNSFPNIEQLVTTLTLNDFYTTK